MIADLGCTDLTVLDVNEPTGPATAYIPTDMSDPDSIDAAIAEIGDGVDVLFNNAGVGYASEFRNADLDNFEWLMNINYWGVVWSTKAFLPYLKHHPTDTWSIYRLFLG